MLVEFFGRKITQNIGLLWIILN